MRRVAELNPSSRLTDDELHVRMGVSLDNEWLAAAERVHRSTGSGRRGRPWRGRDVMGNEEGRGTTDAAREQVTGHTEIVLARHDVSLRTRLAREGRCPPSCAARTLWGVSVERLERFDESLERSRSLGREAIYRVTILSASIVAFSATLLSIEQIDVDADRTLLAVSWCLFAGVVFLGPFSIALEGRAQYLVHWRAFQPQHFDDDREPTFAEN